MQHDYTRDTYKNGWAVVDFEFLAEGKAKMRAFGLKRGTDSENLEDAYLRAGEEVVLSMPDGEVLYELGPVTYQHEPYDQFEAELIYVQHLTGFRIMRQTEEKQRARQLEWGRRISQRGGAGR